MSNVIEEIGSVFAKIESIQARLEAQEAKAAKASQDVEQAKKREQEELDEVTAIKMELGLMLADLVKPISQLMQDYDNATKRAESTFRGFSNEVRDLIPEDTKELFDATCGEYIEKLDPRTDEEEQLGIHAA